MCITQGGNDVRGRQQDHQPGDPTVQVPPGRQQAAQVFVMGGHQRGAPGPASEGAQPRNLIGRQSLLLPLSVESRRDLTPPSFARRHRRKTSEEAAIPILRGHGVLDFRS